MPIEETRAELAESIKQLAGDVRFQVFMRCLSEQADYAIANACSDAALANPMTASAALGEVRCYRDILNLVKEYEDKLDA